MKKIRLSAAFLALTLLAATLLVGCGSQPKTKFYQSEVSEFTDLDQIAKTLNSGNAADIRKLGLKSLAENDAEVTAVTKQALGFSDSVFTVDYRTVKGGEQMPYLSEALLQQFIVGDVIDAVVKNNTEGRIVTSSKTDVVRVVFSRDFTKALVDTDVYITWKEGTQQALDSIGVKAGEEHSFIQILHMIKENGVWLVDGAARGKLSSSK